MFLIVKPRSQGELHPFEDCYLLNLGERLSRAEAEAATDAVAAYLDVDTSPGGGGQLEDFRRGTSSLSVGREASLALRSFGASRVNFPKRELVHAVTDLFCRHVVETWPGELSDKDRKELERRVEQQATHMELAEEPLVARFQTALQSLWGGEPEQYLLKLLASAGLPSQPRATPEAVAAPAELLLDRIEQELGSGQIAGQKDERALTPLNRRLPRKRTGLPVR